MPLLSRPSSRPIWTVLESTELVFDADLVTSNTVDLDINGVAITQVPFNTDHDTTMEDLRAEIEASPHVLSAVLTDISGDNRTIEATPTAAERVRITDIVVAGGASQAAGIATGKVVDNDVFSPESGQPNVDEPLKAVKDIGWSFKQFPPRQWWNWWNRQVSKWFGWMEQELDRGSFTVGFINGTFTPGTYTSGVAYWFRHNGAVTIVLPYLNGAYTVDNGQYIGPIPPFLRVKETDIVLQPEVLLSVNSPSAGPQIGAMRLTEDEIWPIDPQAPYGSPSGWGIGTRTIQPSVVTYWPEYDDSRA